MKIVFNMPIKLELFISILVVFNINLVNKTINNTLVFMTNIIIGDTRKEFDNSVVTYSTQYSLQTVRPRRYSENLNVSVLCPLPPNFGLSRVYDSITLTDKTPKTGKISTKTCRSIHHTGLPIILYRLKISATGSLG